jgi:putative ABC transport system permease protein
MKTADINTLPLIIGFALIIIPIAFSWWFKIGIIKRTLIASFRMGIQLILVGLFLEYLFELNNSLINIAWLMFMILVASVSMIRNSDLKYKVLLFPSFMSLAITTLSIVFFFNIVILNLDNIFDAKYLIAIGGMILGNSLRSNIVGVSSFYKSIKRNENRYLYQLSLGATRLEAILPFFREGFKNAVNPFIAGMATFGIVSIPGMMTGQILGGSSPMLAVKYQITIVIAIFVVTTVSVILTILFTARSSFNGYGVLNKEIFKN